MRKILVPEIIEEKHITTPKGVRCIGYSDSNIKLNFRTELRHNYIKIESIERTYKFIKSNDGSPLSKGILFNRVFKIQNFNIIEKHYETLSTLIYWIMDRISNGLKDEMVITYLISMMWLIVLNNYPWK